MTGFLLPIVGSFMLATGTALGYRWGYRDGRRDGWAARQTALDAHHQRRRLPTHPHPKETR